MNARLWSIHELHASPFQISGMSENRQSRDVRETLRRIEEHPNVVGVIIADGTGSSIYTTLEKEETANFIQQCSALLRVAQNVTREADPTDGLKFFRIRTRKYEIIVAPEQDHLLLVLQNTAKQPSAAKW